MKRKLFKLQTIVSLITILSFNLSFSQLTLIDVAPGPTSSFATDFETAGTAIFFAAVDIGGDDEPHIFDPMIGPTAMKIDVNPSGSSIPAEFTAIGGDVFFSAEDGSGDRELFVFDAMGMLTKIDVDPAGSSMPFRLTNVGGTLFFTATVAGDKEAFYYDGTSVVKIDTDPSGSGDPEEYTMAGGFVFFVATVSGDEELYKYDGTVLTKIDINPSGSSDPNELTTVGSNLYFNGEGTPGDKELFVYDTTLSTFSEIEVSATGSSSPFALYDADGILYFTAEDASDVEMYEYDPGTTTLSKIDINPSGGSYPALFPGNYLKIGTSIFVPAEASGDRELYEFDTVSGMITKIDINAVGSSAPLDLVDMAGVLYFTAGEPSSGKELYRYDGSLTKIELNLSGSGEAGLLTVTDGPALYMGGTDGSTGFELFEYLDPTLSVETQEYESQIGIFPNPINSSELLSLSTPDGMTLETINVYSVNGVKVDSFNYKDNAYDIKIPMLKYASGLYLMTIVTSQGNSIKKIVVR